MIHDALIVKIRAFVVFREKFWGLWGETMILNCQQLFQATENPKINDITLDLLREYYETYLHPYIYQYEITEKRVGK